MKNAGNLLIASDAEDDQHDERLAEYMRMLVHTIKRGTHANATGHPDEERTLRGMTEEGKIDGLDAIDHIITKRSIEETGWLLVRFLNLLEEYNGGDAFHGIVELFVGTSPGSIALWVSIDEGEHDALDVETNILIAAARSNTHDHRVNIHVQVVDAGDRYEVSGCYYLELIDRRSSYEKRTGGPGGTV